MEIKFELYTRKTIDYILGFSSLILLVLSAFCEGFAEGAFEHAMFITLIILFLFGFNYFLHRHYYRAIFGWESFSKQSIGFTESQVTISNKKEQGSIVIILEESPQLKLYYNGTYSISNLIGLGVFSSDGISEINFVYNKQEYTFKFIIATNEKKKELLNILHLWHNRNYVFKEYFNGEKSYLLNVKNT